MKYTERIRELRKENVYTQTYITKSIHVAQTTYSNYENSRLRISIKHLVELARFHDVDTNFITGASDARKAFPQKGKQAENEYLQNTYTRPPCNSLFLHI